ncbi:hypothetical protein VDR83_21960, partial [Xanthomonas campestris pv. campestris]|nr:hypothetical protein [Xanthomonas campestris pv. campestris]
RLFFMSVLVVDGLYSFTWYGSAGAGHNDTTSSITVILYFTDGEWQRVQKIMQELDIKNSKNIVLIDGRSTSKTSASLL